MRRAGSNRVKPSALTATGSLKHSQSRVDSAPTRGRGAVPDRVAPEGATIMISIRTVRGRSGSGRTRFLRLFLTANAAGLLLATSALPARAGGDLPNACDLDSTKPFDVSFGGEIATNYIYRGVTLSANQPVVSASLEIDYAPFYVRFEPSSVKLPTNPAAELGFSAGFCKKILEQVKFDVGVSYLYYAGEIPNPPVTSTSYGEAHATIQVQPVKSLTLTATYAYSPNYSNTGAWEHYVEGGFSVDLPKVLPPDFTWSLSGGAGHSWFGPQSADLGGFPLPAYTHWYVGVAFEYKETITFDLTYHNTDLTKENCFVFTGDPTAVAGGAINLVTNPMGLRSNWCGPALVGTLSFGIAAKDLK